MLRCSEVQILEVTRVMKGRGKRHMWQPFRPLWTVYVNSRLLTGKQSCGANLRFSQLKTALHTSAGSHRGRRGTASETRVDSPDCLAFSTCHSISLISIFVINRGHSLSKRGTLFRATALTATCTSAPAFLFFPGTWEALLPAGKVHPGYPVCYLPALEAFAHLASPLAGPSQVG